MNGNEKWLGKLKDSLEDFQAPVPSSFWNNLEKEIGEGKKGTVHRLWYGVAGTAAAIVLAAILFLPKDTGEESVQLLSHLPQQESAVLETDIGKIVQAEDEEIPGVQKESPMEKGGKEFYEVEMVEEEKGPQTEEVVNLSVEEEPEVLPEEDREVERLQLIKEALYLAEDKGKRKFWMAFSAGNGAAALSLGGSGGVTERSDPLYSASGDGAGNMGNTGSGTEGIPMLDLQQGNLFGLANLGMESNNNCNVVGGAQLYSFMNNGQVYRYYKYNHRQPVRFGISFAVEVTGNIFLESGLSYQLLGSTMENGGEKIHQNLHYLGIPLKANVYFVKGRVLSAYASAGYLLEKCVYGTIDGKKVNPGNWQSAITGNLGLQLSIGGAAGLYIEPGVSGYLGMDDEVISKKNGYMIKSLYSEKPFGITIAGGVRFLF